ncbi:putative nucleic acid-binding Zn-ribbon protein [Chryseobacterium defluvii]|uniref:Putative nucleic acid-binding Zn-ribbon protein n=1 Tax=Chryseobacterium defluvii TaxID=160396 RepID=A0A840KAG0_9FLAO|nr:hypothetical protein [Chryseobacterium defluvii]MBB4804968.1 putative nucleic acid-binding Zn-ribbon protein [Chryseobacterium defluvii]
MKNHYFAGIFGVSLLFFSLNAKAQMQDVTAMTQQRDVLKLHTELMDRQISLEKEKQNNAKILGKTEGLNSQSERKTDKFSSSDPDSTAKDAKKTAKLLKQTESANRELDKSNNRIANIEGEIKKLQVKLEKLRYTVDIKEK